MQLVQISRRLSRAVDALSFAPPVTHVYNPLGYAREPHERFLARGAGGPKQVLLLGMNPGPFGMAQTGVPFGDIATVRDFLGIQGQVKPPKAEHPKRPIQGFDCQRSEVSGSRLWGWVKQHFGTPDAFFAGNFIHNYCPLVFMEAGGKNFTPDKLPVAEREALFAVCDDALRAVVDELEPTWVVGVGAFAQKRAALVLTAHVERGLKIGSVLHPSPASPKANRGWAAQADADLERLGIHWPSGG